MKIVGYCESNKQMGRFSGSVWSPAHLKEELPAPRYTLTNAGKISMKEHKVKNACV